MRRVVYNMSRRLPFFGRATTDSCVRAATVTASEVLLSSSSWPGTVEGKSSTFLQYGACHGNKETNSSFMLWKTASCLAFGSALYVGLGGMPEIATNEAGPLVGEAGAAGEPGVDPEEVMQQVELGLQHRLKSLNLSSSFLAPFTVSAKGQQVSIKFPVSPVCDLWYLIVNVVAQMGKLNADIGGDGKMLVAASDSAVAQVLTLEQKLFSKEKDAGDHGEAKDGAPSGPLCIWLFEPLVGEKFPEIEFLKKGYYSEEELDLVVNILHLSASEKQRETLRSRYKRAHERQKQAGSGKSVFDSLEAMGVKVYGQDTLARKVEREIISWDNIAGYHEQKRELEDTVLLALRCPEVYDSIAKQTRQKFESNRPRAVLFEGPPGTGKTSSARVIANQASVPLLYVPLEAVMSKYYGESEKMLSKVFDSANELPNGAIVFLDEIDSLAMTRNSEMHEATRRMLSVLLRQIDGFDQDSRVVVIAATNRKEDLDPALISRFDSAIVFGLPDQRTREEITAQYARHLTSSELAAIAAATEGMSGRDLRDICQQAERQWASKLIRNHGESAFTYGLPPFEEYVESTEKRRLSHQTPLFGHSPHGRRHSSWPPSVVV